MLYRPDRMARPADWALPIRPGDLWSDDPKDEDYNLIARAPYAAVPRGAPPPGPALRPDPRHRLELAHAVPGRGSAIFIHRWRKPGHPTAGCIGLRPQDLRWIAPRIRYVTRLIVV